MRKISALFIVVLALGVALHADVYIKSNVHTDAMMGQPAKDTVSEQWISDIAVSMNMGDMAFLLDLKANKICIINNVTKTYVETDLPLDMAKILPDQMVQMMGMMKATVTVAPNGQTKQVGQWKCAGYDVTINMMMMPMHMTIWATKDVPFDPKKFMEKAYGQLLKAQSMFLDEAGIKEYMKVEGFQVASDMTMEMMGNKIHTTQEVVEIVKKTPPAGVYSVPAGYTKNDKLSMQDVQKR